MGFGAALGLALFLTALTVVKLGAWLTRPKAAEKSREDGELELIRLDGERNASGSSLSFLGSKALQQNSAGYSRVPGSDQNGSGLKKGKTPRPPAKPRGK